MLISTKSKFDQACIRLACVFSVFFSSLTFAKNPFDQLGRVAEDGKESVMSNVAPIFVIGLLVMLVLRYMNVIGNRVLIGALVCLVFFGVTPMAVEWYINAVK